MPQLGIIYNIARRITDFRPVVAPVLCAVLLSAGTAAGGAMAADSASVVIYHRFGENRYPATNTRLEQLDEHIREYTSGKYTVMPLADIMAAIRKGTPLPDRAVAITIDDAFRSVYTEAWPRLRKAGLPFTLFVATEPVGSGLPDYMTWDQLREMRNAGVAIGAHSHTHLHMIDADMATNRAEIEASNRIFQSELGKIPNLFAYPYGEADLAIMAMIKNAGYAEGFGQHSGALDASLPRYYLPRFPLNEAYGTLDRLRTALNALPLPVSDVTPADPLLPPDGNPPALGFTLAGSFAQDGRLACYHSPGGKARLERVGPSRIEARFEAPFAPGRSRVNCTLPGPAGRWYWYGTQYYVKKR